MFKMACPAGQNGVTMYTVTSGTEGVNTIPSVCWPRSIWRLLQSRALYLNKRSFEEHNYMLINYVLLLDLILFKCYGLLTRRKLEQTNKINWTSQKEPEMLSLPQSQHLSNGSHHSLAPHILRSFLRHSTRFATSSLLQQNTTLLGGDWTQSSSRMILDGSRLSWRMVLWSAISLSIMNIITNT